MNELEPGHIFALRTLDGDDGGTVWLTFVKRVGDGYPGNEPPAHTGTTTQEVLRALIARTVYVDGQIHDPANARVLFSLRQAIYELEDRAARRHGRELPREARLGVHASVGYVGIETLPTCELCNHIGCPGSCRA